MTHFSLLLSTLLLFFILFYLCYSRPFSVEIIDLSQNSLWRVPSEKSCVARVFFGCNRPWIVCDDVLLPTTNQDLHQQAHQERNEMKKCEISRPAAAGQLSLSLSRALKALTEIKKPERHKKVFMGFASRRGREGDRERVLCVSVETLLEVSSRFKTTRIIAPLSTSRLSREVQTLLLMWCRHTLFNTQNCVLFRLFFFYDTHIFVCLCSSSHNKLAVWLRREREWAESASAGYMIIITPSTVLHWLPTRSKSNELLCRAQEDLWTLSRGAKWSGDHNLNNVNRIVKCESSQLCVFHILFFGRSARGWIDKFIVDEQQQQQRSRARGPGVWEHQRLQH